jgi:flagella basal body P-ring formation protein FlgA
MKIVANTILALLLTALGAAAQQPPSDLGATRAFVYLDASATVSGAQIKLSDVAEVSGFDDDLIGRLQNMSLGQSPQPGKTTTIERSDIRRQMANWRIDAVRVALAGENEVTVERKGRKVSSGEITALVERWVADSWSDQDVRTEVVYTRMPDELSLEHEAFTLRVLDPVKHHATGAMAIGVAALDEDRVLARFPVSVRVRAWQEVAVAAAELQRGQIVTTDDITFADRELNKLRGASINSVDDVVGKRLMRRIRAGQVITSNHVENPPLVERGDEVFLLVEFNGITVGCSGKASQKGGRGDRILVRNQYGRNLTGVIKDGRTVVITP